MIFIVFGVITKINLIQEKTETNDQHLSRMLLFFDVWMEKDYPNFCIFYFVGVRWNMYEYVISIKNVFTLGILN